MAKRIYVLLISALVFVGSWSFVSAEDTVMTERSFHALSGDYGRGCIYAWDVNLTQKEILSMDDLLLEEYIIDRSGYELYVQPCMTNGHKNADSRLPNSRYPEMPAITLETGSIERLRSKIPDKGRVQIPTKVVIKGSLSGELVIMVYITYVDEGTTPEPDPPLAPEDKPEPGSIKKPGGLENPSSSALQQEAPVAGGSVSTNQPEVEVATQDPMEVEPPEPFITGDASRPPLRQETTGSKLKEEGLELGGALFALAGLAALSFAWSIGSDLRVILWFRRKSREIGSRR